MSESAKKLYYRKNGTVYSNKLYTSLFDINASDGNYLTVKYGGTPLYAKLVPTNNTTFSDIYIRKSSNILSVASHYENSLYKEDLNEHYSSDAWVTLPGTLSFYTPSTMNVNFNLDIWQYQDDGPSQIGARIIVDDTVSVCEFTANAGWNSGSGGDYTVTDSVWIDRYNRNKLYHNGASDCGVNGANPGNKSGQLTIGAGTHTAKVQVWASGWARARSTKWRTITLS